jgi:hypothetical protein
MERTVHLEQKKNFDFQKDNDMADLVADDNTYNDE